MAVIPKPAVAACIAFLADALPDHDFDGVFVSSKTPGPATGHASLPRRYIRVTRSGGGMVNTVTDNARLLVECYSDDSADAEVLANVARGALRASAGRRVAGAFIRGVDVDVDDGPTDYPDPLVPSHDRYQFQVALMVSTN